MKKLYILILAIFMFACHTETEREKHIKELQKEAIDIIAEATTKMEMDKIITSDQSLQIIQEFTKIFADSAEIGYQYALKIKEQAENPFANTVQKDFIKQKIADFKTYLESEPIIEKTSPTVDQFKKDMKKMNTDFLKENGNKLVDWVGTISCIDCFKDIPNFKREKELDITIIIQDKIKLGEKTIQPRPDYSTTMECSYYFEVTQATINSIGCKGISKSSKVYESVKKLNAGQKVKFSAKIIKADDVIEKTGLNLSTGFYIEITEINPL